MNKRMTAHCTVALYLFSIPAEAGCNESCYLYACLQDSVCRHQVTVTLRHLFHAASTAANNTAEDCGGRGDLVMAGVVSPPPHSPGQLTVSLLSAQEVAPPSPYSPLNRKSVTFHWCERDI